MFWDPYDEIIKMHEEMERIFNKLYRGNGGILEDKKNLKALANIGKGYRSPVADVEETESAILANFELPGADKSDIDLSIDENSIEVRVEKKDEKKIDEKGMKGFSTSYSSFYRRIPLSVEVDSSKAKAKYENGMLRIEVPKLQVLEHKKKKIDID